jgi:hypothetical protein
MANLRPTLNRCPRRWERRDGTVGGPCPAYLDADDDRGVLVCTDHGDVAKFDVPGEGDQPDEGQEPSPGTSHNPAPADAT